MEARKKTAKGGASARSKISSGSLVNALYLTSSKAIIVFLIAVATFVASSQILDVVLLYTENQTYVVNAFKQGPRFNYRKSEPLKLEVKNTLSAILDYSLKYSSPEGFESPDMIRFATEDAEKNCQKQIETTLQILDYETKNGSVKEEYFQNGFVTKNPNGCTVNKAAVEEHYRKQYDELLESQKRLDEGYRSVTDALNALRSVSYAVFDRTEKRLSTDEKVSSLEEAQKLFSSKENCLMVFDSKNPYYVHGSLDDMSALIEELSESYEHDFDIFVSFPADMVFSPACEKIESTYREIYRSVTLHLSISAAVSAIGLALTVLLLCLSGRRERGGAPKYALSDKLPNILHIALHLSVSVSAALLVKDSLYLILNPHLGTEWLTVSPDYFILRAEVCSALCVLFTLAAVCCIKRHCLHKTLFKNTLVCKVIDLVKRKKER